MAHLSGINVVRPFLFFVLTLFAAPSAAQLPDCGGSSDGQFYYSAVAGGQYRIYSFDPGQPLSATNPRANNIQPLSFSSGLAISKVLGGGAPITTFYTVAAGMFYYFDGSAWFSTGHSAGPATAMNIGAGGGYIFNLEAATGTVYRYDGTANAVPILTVPGMNLGVIDIVADGQGNFYLLNTSGVPYLRKYSSNGSLLQSWSLTGVPVTIGGGGFSIIGTHIYYNAGNIAMYRGDIGCSSIAFNSMPAPWGSNPPLDLAECPYSKLDTGSTSQTVYACKAPFSMNYTAAGFSGYQWQVLEGAPVITGTGPAFAITSSQKARIVFSSASICGMKHDTLHIFHAGAAISMKNRDTVWGCGSYQHTLNALVVPDVSSGIQYQYQWTPASYVLSGGNSLSPVVAPPAGTTFTLAVSTPAGQGGCRWTDTVQLHTEDRSVAAGFSYSVRHGCAADTVDLVNTSLAATHFLWTYGDGTTGNAPGGQHVYSTHQNYQVRLIARNGFCADTAEQSIDLSSRLAASFTIPDDTICQGGVLQFQNTSVFDPPSAGYSWDFGDGQFSTSSDPQHGFGQSGSFPVRLVVTDFRTCTDTAYATVVVDPAPGGGFTLSDSTLCAGEAVLLTPQVTTAGLSSLRWDLGDGTLSGSMTAIEHIYSGAGSYRIRLEAVYRACGSVEMEREVGVKPLPVPGLGRDTTICLDKQPFLLGRVPLEGELWSWNTGDTSAPIRVSRSGRYMATVNFGGCAASDTVDVEGRSCDCRLVMPDVFSPNGDGLNDLFRPVTGAGCEVRAFELSVYNRWGQLVFQSNNAAWGWDGRFGGIPVDAGDYKYMLRYATGDFERQHMTTGDVVVIR